MQLMNALPQSLAGATWVLKFVCHPLSSWFSTYQANRRKHQSKKTQSCMASASTPAAKPKPCQNLWNLNSRTGNHEAVFFCTSCWRSRRWRSLRWMQSWRSQRPKARPNTTWRSRPGCWPSYPPHIKQITADSAKMRQALKQLGYNLGRQTRPQNCKQRQKKAMNH